MYATPLPTPIYVRASDELSVAKRKKANIG